MTSIEFQDELQTIDPDFTVVENDNRPGLSNIFYKGKNFDLPVISTHNIKDEVDTGHRYEFPNGMSVRHHSKGEIISRLEQFLIDYKGGLYYDD